MIWALQCHGENKCSNNQDVKSNNQLLSITKLFPIFQPI